MECLLLPEAAEVAKGPRVAEGSTSVAPVLQGARELLCDPAWKAPRTWPSVITVLTALEWGSCWCGALLCPLSSLGKPAPAHFPVSPPCGLCARGAG